MEGLKIPFLFSSLLFPILIISNATDNLSITDSITGNQTLVSSHGSFEMGFFRPGSSQNLYLGIWYKGISPRTVVWVANRETPLLNSSGVLKFIDPGTLVLSMGGGINLWSAKATGSTQNPVAQLLDSGNLVLRDSANNPDNFLWQSFDYPSDTLLPGQKLGKNFVTGLERKLSSWKSNDDPARGDLTYQCDPEGYPQNTLWRGSDKLYRTGPWNGFKFSGTPNPIPIPVCCTNEFVFNDAEVYFRYQLVRRSVLFSRYSLNQSSGRMERWNWIDPNPTNGWNRQLTLPGEECDNYKLCGPYGSCNGAKTPLCDCLSKFVPNNTTNWGNGDWFNGCVRRTPLNCSGDGFVQYSGYKMPDTQHSWYNRTMDLRECESVCLRNCSCMAYTSLDTRGGGSGCLLWFRDLIDMKDFSVDDQQFIYIRMASSELAQQVGSNGKRRRIIIVTLALFAGMLVLGLCIMLYVWKRKKKKKKNSELSRDAIPQHNFEQGYTDKNQNEDLELPLFQFYTIADSTNNFSSNNKIGEGGFGTVYKGWLEGQEIAVKRLSTDSRQGVDEFKNEVICIAKLQHRNLVKLLGCCIQGEERMLIYEFMPNKSLDLFIFDGSGRTTLLDWCRRFNIINGVACGLVYLHRDSRLRIIHRDLKASNVLLDIEMNPKISDFGMARIFGGNETERNTKRVVGTYGYMAPEYAVDGLFSVKSDVFSFGVLVLEIVSGKRNRGFFDPEHLLNLLGHAWMLYKQDRPTELIDEAIRDSCCLAEALRSIQVGLLCVQRHPEDRPTMSSVVLMLGSEGALPSPKHPGFFTERNVKEADSSSSLITKIDAPSSSNDFTITVVQPR